MAAQKEAKLLGNKYISTEHILLGLLGTESGLAAKVLHSAGIDVNVTREHAEKLSGRGGGCSGLACAELRFTHDAKNVLELSLKQATLLGGQLTEAVSHRSHAVVLFDEINKAHSDAFNLMLQILDDGRLTDGKGQTVDFKSTLIIMTSNLGNNIIEEGSGETRLVIDKDNSVDHKKNLVMEELKLHLRPEFLNRLDEIIVFKQLTKLEVEQIANIMLKEVSQRLMAKDIHLSVTCRFRDHVVQHGYNTSYGARPLRRTIARLLEDTLAEKILIKKRNEGRRLSCCRHQY
ncbi:P-loop containing nucleoside triphosphate hydrolase [Sesbania bispinosa]|nr:P-loop containing nucleoside triphosphate hydrolase [Sesbania bispinosa]